MQSVIARAAKKEIVVRAPVEQVVARAAFKAINARATQEQPKTEEDLALPGTASGWELTLAFGLSLILFGAALLHGRSAIALRGRALTASVRAMRATHRRRAK